MFWGSRHKDEAPAPSKTSDEQGSEQKAVQRQKLSPQLQQLVDKDDKFYDDVYSPYSVDSTETPYRYAAYATRIRTILLSAHRYVAYTSDIGESFRPVAHPYLVRSAYGISWAYLLGDVGHEGYKAYLRNRRVLAPPCEAYKDASSSTSSSTLGNLSDEGEVIMGMATGNLSGPLAGSEGGGEGADTLTPWPTTSIPLIEDYRMVMAKRAVFQGIASMGLPALTIHSVVKYSGRMFKNSKIALFRTWAPIGLGLSIVPFLPFIFDEPIDEAVDWTFRTALRAYAGEDAVRPLDAHASSSHTTTSHESGEDDDSSSWEEFKEQRQRARDQRKQDREVDGKSSSSGIVGSLAMLGWGGGSSASASTETETEKRKKND